MDDLCSSPTGFGLAPVVLVAVALILLHPLCTGTHCAYIFFLISRNTLCLHSEIK
jgi:hypothetical protein